MSTGIEKLIYPLIYEGCDCIDLLISVTPDFEVDIQAINDILKTMQACIAGLVSCIEMLHDGENIDTDTMMQVNENIDSARYIIHVVKTDFIPATKEVSDG